MKSKSFLLCLALLFPVFEVFGQVPPVEPANLQTDLVSTWLITVGTDSKSFERALKIKGLTSNPEGGFALDIDYSILGNKADHPKANLVVQQGQSLKVVFTTGANSKIIAEQIADGSFQGTFTDAKGVVIPLKMVKISAESLREKEAQIVAMRANATLNAAPVIEMPAANVPATCGAFVGAWSGQWPFSGRLWLWVVSVDSKCVAKFAYTGSTAVPKDFLTAEIKDGQMTIPRPGGTTTFQVRGDEIVGRYVGSESNNGGSMQKIDLSGDALATLRTEQRTAQAVAVAPPTADVPAACASFYGAWTGAWSYGGFGALWLRVVGVDANCNVKLSYRESSEIPKSFSTAQIRDGALAFVCNTNTGGGGTCVFQRKGNDLWANYSNSAGVRNQAVFRKSD